MRETGERKPDIMYKGVFFDLDGTLLNTIDDLAAAGNYALTVQGFAAHDTQRYKYMVGNGIPKLIERMLPEGSSPELKEKTHKLFSEYYSTHSADKTRPYEGISELLTRLKESGIICAVISNKDNEFSAGLIHSFFPGLTAAVYGSVEGYPKKPDPYWVNKALDDLKLSRDSVLYVGDSGVDMLTAANAGIVCAGVLWGFRQEEELRNSGAVHICSKPSDISDIVLENDVQ